MRWHILAGRVTVLYQYNPARVAAWGKDAPSIYRGGFKPPETLSSLASGSGMLWLCIPLTCNNPAMAVLTMGECHLADLTGIPLQGPPKGQEQAFLAVPQGGFPRVLG